MIKKLLLVPTEFERSKLLAVLPQSFRAELRSELCGFGPIAAAAATSLWIERLQPKLVLLAGIAGTYDNPSASHEQAEQAVGQAYLIDRVFCNGVGVGRGATALLPSQLGFAQWSGDATQLAEETVHDTIDLLPSAELRQQFPVASAITVCGASANADEAAKIRQQHPTPAGCVLEEMETFAVALACLLTGTPLLTIRGVSNVAGDRDVSRWQVDPAINSVAGLLQEVSRFDSAVRPPKAV